MSFSERIQSFKNNEKIWKFDDRLFDDSGRSIGFINDGGVYDYNGVPRGQFIDGYLYDNQGAVVGFSDFSTSVTELPTGSVSYSSPDFSTSVTELPTGSVSYSGLYPFDLSNENYVFEKTEGYYTVKKPDHENTNMYETLVRKIEPMRSEADLFFEMPIVDNKKCSLLSPLDLFTDNDTLSFH